MKYLCEPVEEPREVEQYLSYFCGDPEDPKALDKTETLRISFYKLVAKFVRAFSAISQDLKKAGYTDVQISELNNDVQFFSDTRSAIKKYSGEELDVKPYEADMRHLINTYIHADPADQLGTVDNHSLVDLIIKTGINDAIAKKLNQKGKFSKNAIAEGITNNIRKKIIREQLADPRFYKEMSKLLDDLIKQRRKGTLSYEKFLHEAEAIVMKIAGKSPSDGLPSILNGQPLATVLFNNLTSIPADSFICPTDENERAQLALDIDKAMQQKAPAGWKEDGQGPRGNQVLNTLFLFLERDRKATKAVFDILLNQ